MVNDLIDMLGNIKTDFVIEIKSKTEKYVWNIAALVGYFTHKLSIYNGPWLYFMTQSSLNYDQQDKIKFCRGFG